MLKRRPNRPVIIKRGERLKPSIQNRKRRQRKQSKVSSISNK